jgi:hypothetical protein
MRLQYGFIVRPHLSKKIFVKAHTDINMYRDPCGDKQFGQLTLFFALALLRDSSGMTLILIVLA